MIKIKDEKASTYLKTTGLNVTSAQAIKKLSAMGVKNAERIYWAWRKGWMTELTYDESTEEAPDRSKTEDDLKELILRDYFEGKKAIDISKDTGVRYSVVNSHIRRFREKKKA